MNTIWDTKSDIVQKGDNLRDVTPLMDKTRIDENDFTHYIFSKTMFNNPWYVIPDNDLELFNKFIEGGSRAYPSDGNVPCDIVAKEARILLNKIIDLSRDSTSHHFEEARKALENGKNSLVRGTLKLYLGKYTTRDWRRKRFTDDIDFWTFNINILNSALMENGFTRNKKTREWEKQISWIYPKTNERRIETLYASNDVNQLLDFGAGSYLDGASLKEIFHKKIKRGHDVDLSDIINVAMVNNCDYTKHREEWIKAWEAFEEAANTRNTRTISNMISLCRYSIAITDHLNKISNAIEKHHNLIFDKSQYPDYQIKSICKISIHWIKFCKNNSVDIIREMIHNFLIEEMEGRRKYRRNLNNFIQNILKLINSKFIHQNIIFEIENSG